MNYREAADYAGVNVATIIEAVKKKELKAYKYEMARIGNDGTDKPNYFVDIGAGDVDKWLAKHMKDFHRPQRLITYVYQDEYDEFVNYCAKKNQKCSWIIRELICEELKKHGIKLKRDYPSNQI